MLQDDQITNKCQRFVWDSALDLRLIAMRDQGYTYPRIATLLGCPNDRICRRRYDLLRPKDDELETITQGAPYSPAEKERFKELYLQKTPVISMQEIAKLMGRSKNAICGLRKRLGLPKRPSIAERGVPNPYGPPNHNKRADGRPRAPKKATDQSGLDAALKNMEAATDAGFKDGGKTFAQLTTQCCRFIHGDPKKGDHRFCGAPTIPSKSWCQRHYKVVHRDDIHKV